MPIASTQSGQNNGNGLGVVTQSPEPEASEKNPRSQIEINQPAHEPEWDPGRSGGSRE